MAKDSEILTLYKYFYWSDKMKATLDDLFNQSTKEIIPHARLEGESNLYMSYWYGGLYVVIEGWKELGLVDKNIDALLISPNTDLLRRYRNGVFHFRKDYFDEHFLGFIRDGVNSMEWIRKIHLEFKRYFLTWFKQKHLTFEIF